ncbi:hypothetical protein AGOR_G00185780 [Albula goreensis]|uniref:Proline-rich protein 5 n=1 Tax=Albula goreensis TaxID=1534307 RepID=A0A8T3D1H8_9TELE|nr:hypothetical protein AGOR_G00185780 [Albula goreensis]
MRCPAPAPVSPSIIQMLLILQGVHESKGVSDDYLKLESLIQKVVSPYLGTHGIFSDNGTIMQCSCVLEKRLLRRWPKPGEPLAKNPVVRSKSYNIPMLTPVVEYDSEVGSVGSVGIRRHSVCEMTSCAEEQGYASLVPGADASSRASVVPKTGLPGEQDPGGLAGGVACGEAASHSPLPSPSIFPELSPGSFHGAEVEDEGQASPSGLVRDPSCSAPSCSSSPETIVDQILESMDSEPEGIFIDFPHRCSDPPGYSRDNGRQSVV